MKISSTYTTTRTEVQCVCRACGKEFWKRVADVKAGGGQYCSRECHHKGQSGRRNVRGLLYGGKVQVDLSVTRTVTTIRKSTKGTPRARKYELSR